MVAIYSAVFIASSNGLAGLAWRAMDEVWRRECGRALPLGLASCVQPRMCGMRADFCRVVCLCSTACADASGGAEPCWTLC